MTDTVPLPFDPIAEARRHWVARGWEHAAQTMAVVTSVMRVQQILLGRADAALRRHGLTFARYEVLMLLSFSRRGELPLGRIGARLQVNPASVTNAVGRLEAQGLVARVPNPRDGRGTLARLTDAGRARALEATETLNGALFCGLGLERTEEDRLFALLRDVREAAGDFSGAAALSDDDVEDR
ncbi:MAG: MarR family winged helix-turn-helix transcriptional regulator [Acidimicrobiales bacterium]